MAGSDLATVKIKSFWKRTNAKGKGLRERERGQVQSDNSLEPLNQTLTPALLGLRIIVYAMRFLYKLSHLKVSLILLAMQSTHAWHRVVAQ